MSVPFDKFEEKPLPRGRHWRESFDSRYLRHFWLGGKKRIVTIVATQELNSSNKRETKKQLLITLAESEKKWAANVTNCGIIEMLTGKADPTEWPGTKIELYPTKTRAVDGSGMVDCIRVSDVLPPQDGRTEKPKHRQEVSQWLFAMKEAKDIGALVTIGNGIKEDLELTPEEQELLARGLRTRTAQITETP